MHVAVKKDCVIWQQTYPWKEKKKPKHDVYVICGACMVLHSRKINNKIIQWDLYTSNLLLYLLLSPPSSLSLSGRWHDTNNDLNWVGDRVPKHRRLDLCEPCRPYRSLRCLTSLGAFGLVGCVWHAQIGGIEKWWRPGLVVLPRGTRRSVSIVVLHEHALLLNTLVNSSTTSVRLSSASIDSSINAAKKGWCPTDSSRSTHS